MIKEINYKPLKRPMGVLVDSLESLKHKGEIYVFGRRVTYNNGLRLKYVPYKVIVCLTALARLGEGDKLSRSNKGLKKVEVLL